MTLQQLKYVITISKSGSMHTAADELFITQPNLSKAIKDLELEMGITIFNRTNKGVLLTDDGTKFLSYARQVVEQANLLEDIYKNKESIKRIFAISSQHYGFVVNAFVKLVETLGKDTYEFSLRECKTYDVINDVKDGRSELGVIYFSRFNSEIMKKVISSNGLSYEFLFEAKPHVLLSKNHPLANKERLTLDDLDAYPRLSYDQGLNNSFYYSEEPHALESVSKAIVVSDRATLFNILIGLNGYTISSGMISSSLDGNNIISIPLETDEVMDLVYIYDSDKPMKEITKQYLAILREYISGHAL
ncbi:MAG TPA: LysR family transcriptional regulator [Acholeplasmatales bacterium]|uniref:LysR family transcriptional regulator n=1 Tax=Methanobrevibacter smithii TaxID=2173 RepID=UPI000969091E|nr:MAG: LysR family transcriptional regulator [Clostridium sp. CAG:307_30_263]HCS25712.1 LysR family transcriptional regulator [Acholeplasmatales bacterium]